MNDGGERSKTTADNLDPVRAQALHASLDLGGAPPGIGSRLPAFWHQIYFWEALPAGQLGPDGHGRTGGFIPDLGLPQRMWAGGSLEFERPLILGVNAVKTSAVENISEKAGRSGQLAFVTVRHEIRQEGALALTERQNLVYREGGKPSEPKQSEMTAEASRPAVLDPVLLFRYSALTFNGHRIHYDADYCRDIAGYSGLIVHGPLLSTMLAGEAEAVLGRLRSFEYRAVAPVHAGEELLICRKRDANGLQLWFQDPSGGLRMIATAHGT